MTSCVVWTVERFGFWDREKRALLRAFSSGAELRPWLDNTIANTRRKSAIDTMLQDYLFLLKADANDHEPETWTRAKKLRVLRRRGVRVVRASLHTLAEPAGKNGVCAFDGTPGVHYHVTTVRKNGTGLVSFPIAHKRELARFAPRVLPTAPRNGMIGSVSK